MAIKKRPVSPRQKMINLMYVVLMAMLALNVSTEVLQGFSLVEESLNRTTANSSQQNATMYDSFEEQMKKNPEKVRQWFEKATTVKQMSDSLYNFAQQLKEAIVREADGKNGDVKNIENKENLEAANQVMLAPGTGKGKALYDAINAYRTKILSMVTDEQQKKIISSNLSTELPKNAMTMGKNWQEYMFEDMPVAAAVTLLSKLQSDIRYAEGEVLHTLVANVDVKDIRVNKLDAFVIPEKTTLYPGEQFVSQIVMAAVDTTMQPEIYINGTRVNTTNGRYSFSAGGVGEHQFSGYLLSNHTQCGRRGTAPRLHPEVQCDSYTRRRYRGSRPHERALCRIQEPYQRQRAGHSCKPGYGEHERRKPHTYGQRTLHRRAVGSGQGCVVQHIG